jgi:hypothetical protein
MAAHGPSLLLDRKPLEHKFSAMLVAELDDGCLGHSRAYRERESAVIICGNFLRFEDPPQFLSHLLHCFVVGKLLRKDHRVDIIQHEHSYRHGYQVLKPATAKKPLSSSFTDYVAST